MVSPVIKTVNILLKQYCVVTGADNTQAIRVVREQYDGSSVTNNIIIYIEQEKEGTEDSSLRNIRFNLYPGGVSTIDDHMLRSRGQVV